MKSYRVGNWSDYNKSLVNRGSLTLWISPEIVNKWQPVQETSPKGGRPCEYSDDMILSMLQLREVFSLTLRATQGFVASLFELAGINMPVPNYSVLSRRAKHLKKRLKKFSQRGAVEIAVDSTGLKVTGDGEWNAKKHGPQKRRQWRKVHVAIDPNTHHVVSVVSTPSNVADSTVLPDLLKEAPRGVKRVYGDGAYDGKPSRECIASYGAQGIVPPPKNARIRRGKSKALNERNNWVAAVEGLGGDDIARGLAKKLTGYHKRSLVETAMSRIKGLFGGELRSRTAENQDIETHLRCGILNKFTDLGMPNSSWA